MQRWHSVSQRTWRDNENSLTGASLSEGSRSNNFDNKIYVERNKKYGFSHLWLSCLEASTSTLVQNVLKPSSIFRNTPTTFVAIDMCFASIELHSPMLIDQPQFTKICIVQTFSATLVREKQKKWNRAKA